jgi:hypothetical protein
MVENVLENSNGRKNGSSNRMMLRALDVLPTMHQRKKIEGAFSLIEGVPRK